MEEEFDRGLDLMYGQLIRSTSEEGCLGGKGLDFEWQCVMHIQTCRSLNEELPI